MNFRAILILISIMAISHVSLAGELDLDVQKTTTKNGIDILTLVNKEMPVASFQIFVRAGSRHEVLPNTPGLAHIFEHLMFRGTPKHPDFVESLNHTGFYNNADTSRDRTRYFADVRSEYLDEIISVEADRFKHLNFNRQAFNAELGPVRQEREMGVDNSPGGFLWEKFYEHAFNVHTYGHSVIGGTQDIVNMTYENAYHFYSTHYQPKNIFIVVVGNFDRQKALRSIEKEFSGDWQRKSNTDFLKQPMAEPPQKKSEACQLRMER